MAPLSLGFAALIMENPVGGEVPGWEAIRTWAELSESHGFDTFWIPDELVWEDAENPERTAGWWECVSVAAAVSAVTDGIQIGTWVLSALHRNPGLTVKAVETLDEISGGRLVFGFGAGHAGRQGEAFGFPLDKTVGRYEEALKVVVALLRDGEADYSGDFHSAVRQQSRPRGPSCGTIPLMLGGHGPRTIGLAVDYADVWSGYATSSSQPEAFVDRLQLLDEVCEKKGRDPKDIGRSIGVAVVPPGTEPGWLTEGNEPVSGSTEEIAETLLKFADLGVDSIELMMDTDPGEGIPALSDALDMVRSA